MSLFKSQREKYLFFFVIFAVALPALIFTVVLPARNNVKRTNRKLAKIEKQLQELSDNLAKVDEINSDYHSIADFITNNHENLDSQLVKEIYQVCRNLGINYPKIDPEPLTPIEGVSGFGEIAISLNVTGTHHIILKLLDELENSGFIAKSISFSINQTDAEVSFYGKFVRIIDISNDAGDDNE